MHTLIYEECQSPAAITAAAQHVHLMTSNIASENILSITWNLTVCHIQKGQC